MRWRHKSLRRRLELWLMLPLLAICTVILFEAWFTARDSANRAYNRSLRGSALSIADRIVRIDGEIQVDLPYVALEMLTSGGEDRVFYRILGNQGEFITGYRTLPDPPEPTDKASPFRYYDAEFRGETIRVVDYRGELTDQGVTYPFRVQVAETKIERERLAREILLRWSSRLLFLLAIVAAISWIAISKGLRPLRQLEKSVARRNRNDLSPMKVEVPEEVRSLVDSINALLERLGNNLESMQRFIDDSAHQLKTPLAAIRTQAQQAQASKDPQQMSQALEKVQQIAIRANHLVSQLLSLARATPGVDRYSRFSRLNLVELASSVTSNWVPKALLRSIDLGFESNTNEITLEADQLMLEELLGILLDNACSYCPGGSKVTVRVDRPDSGHARLLVEDDGPGIAPELHERVLERFYRVDNDNGEGSGLGLAIVREFANAHQASLQLSRGVDDRGLKITLLFPLAAE